MLSIFFSSHNLTESTLPQYRLWLWKEPSPFCLGEDVEVGVVWSHRYITSCVWELLIPLGRGGMGHISYFSSPVPSSPGSPLYQNSYYNQGFKLESNTTATNSSGRIIWSRIDTWPSCLEYFSLITLMFWIGPFLDIRIY